VVECSQLGNNRGEGGKMTFMRKAEDPPVSNPNAEKAAKAAEKGTRTPRLITTETPQVSITPMLSDKWQKTRCGGRETTSDEAGRAIERQERATEKRI